MENGSQGPVDLGFEPTEAERRPYAIHQSGKWYTNENIDHMLMERHLNKKARRSSHKNHMKESRKRTEEDDVRFAQSFEKLILIVKSKEGILEQLQKWYEDRHLPPYDVTRFFIGINYTNPKAFGIYKDGNEFVVYKNKADGQRAIRYRGTDEAYAVNELYLKLKDEILNQKAHNQDRRSGVVNSSSTNSTDGNKRSPAKWSGVLKNGLFVLGIIAIIIVMFNYYKVDYYRYNDTIYVNSRYEWFEYDGYDYDVVDESDIPADMLDNKSTYGFDYSDSKWDSSITEFKDSNYYAEHYDSSDQDSDFDWDSGDSWDSNDTNWDSDW